jgi:hypothetical protein
MPRPRLFSLLVQPAKLNVKRLWKQQGFVSKWRTKHSRDEKEKSAKLLLLPPVP